MSKWNCLIFITFLIGSYSKVIACSDTCVSSTVQIDQTNAQCIQEIIDCVSKKFSNPWITFAPGKYLIDKPIELNTNQITLSGKGAILSANWNQDDPASKNHALIRVADGKQIKSLTIKGFVFTLKRSVVDNHLPNCSNSTDTSGARVIGIDLRRASYSRLFDLSITSENQPPKDKFYVTQTIGLLLGDASTNNSIEQLTFIDSNNLSIGVWLETGAEKNTFKNDRFRNLCTSYHIESGHNLIQGSETQHVRDVIYDFQSPSATFNQITGGYVEQTQAIFLARFGTVTENLTHDNTIAYGGATGIDPLSYIEFIRSLNPNPVAAMIENQRAAARVNTLNLNQRNIIFWANSPRGDCRNQAPSVLAGSNFCLCNLKEQPNGICEY